MENPGQNLPKCSKVLKFLLIGFPSSLLLITGKQLKLMECVWVGDRGDNINGYDPNDRIPDPQRLVSYRFC